MTRGVSSALLVGLLALGGCLDPVVGGECRDGYQADGRRCALVGAEDGGLPDGGDRDAGAVDAGRLDGGRFDGGPPRDGGPPGDGAVPEGGLPDGAVPDGGFPGDGGVPTEGGPPADAGPVDGGPPPTCSIGELACDGVCVLPDRDPLHCGDCDVVCDADQFCVDGSCEDACEDPFALCRGLCVDYDTDPLNCGRCGRVCASGICMAGACTSAPGHVVVVGHDFASAPVSAMNRIAGNSLFIARGAPVRVLVYEGDARSTSMARIDAAFDTVARATGRSWSRTEAMDAADVTLRLRSADAFVIYPQRDATDDELSDLGAEWSAALDAFLAGGGVVLLFESGGSHDGTWQILDSAGLFAATARHDVSGDDLDVVAAGDAVAVGVPTPYVGRTGTFQFDTTASTVVVEHLDGPVVIHDVILP